MRLVKDYQLSMRGYRNCPTALDFARSLWLSPDPSVWSHYTQLYVPTATRVRRPATPPANHLSAPVHDLRRRLLTTFLQLTKGNVKWGSHSASDVSSRVETLIESVRSEKEGVHLSRGDVLLARDWKMVRSRVRPSWSALDVITEDKTRSSTAEAFAVLDGGEANWREAMDVMCNNSKTSSLHGVGPATASLLLSLRCPDVPFFGEEAVRVAIPNSGMSYSYR